MPKLWSESIDGHHREVRETILDTTVALATEFGPHSVRMSQIAERIGIGRAALERYFPDVESILLAWHNRRIASHLELLAQVRDQATNPEQRLAAVLQAYAHLHQQRTRHLMHNQHGDALSAFLHREEHVADARQQVHQLVRDLLVEVAATGNLRDDATPDELAVHCLHALGAASNLSTIDAVRQLVSDVLAGLRRPS